MENYKCKSVGIIGSGIQGLCIGLQLLKKGIPTTIFDREEPGMMASYGNAGHFSPYAVLQLNRPDVLYDIPKMLKRWNSPTGKRIKHWLNYFHLPAPTIRMSPKLEFYPLFL